ncbi:MAG: hypothetical protein M1828_004743 [Chrysothrix sp. TS-e1954]|nr:MAG: hypothetical protein M1828_004743 [Chrysothrix sp. TS-e1954]
MPRIFQRPISPVPSNVKNKTRENGSVLQGAEEEEDATTPDQSTTSNKVGPGDTYDDDDDVPTAFPHAPLPLANFEHPRGYTQRHVRNKHIDVLNTILHKSVLSRDWSRASRAFGLLLRSSLSGVRMDLRESGHWGLGGEILLRQGSKTSSPGLQAHGPVRGTEEVDVQWFTAEGFDTAKEYYERLILQYPSLRQDTARVDASTFYPVMIRLWIMQVQLYYQQTSLDHKDGDQRQSDDSSAHIENQCKQTQLNEARIIARYIQEQGLKNRSNDNTELLELQHMVSTWISDLEADCSKSTPELNSPSTGNDSMVTGD